MSHDPHSRTWFALGIVRFVCHCDWSGLLGAEAPADMPSSESRWGHLEHRRSSVRSYRVSMVWQLKHREVDLSIDGAISISLYLKSFCHFLTGKGSWKHWKFKLHHIKGRFKKSQQLVSSWPSIMRVFVLSCVVALLFSVCSSAAAITNAQRLARGLPPLPPKFGRALPGYARTPTVAGTSEPISQNTCTN